MKKDVQFFGIVKISQPEVPFIYVLGDSQRTLLQCCGQVRITLMRIRIIDTFHFDLDPDPDPSFHKKAQILEKVLKQVHIPYILACHLQIDVDSNPDPAYHFDADPDTDPPAYRFDPDPTFQFDAYPDPQHCSPDSLMVLCFS